MSVRYAWGLPFASNGLLARCGEQIQIGKICSKALLFTHAAAASAAASFKLCLLIELVSFQLSELVAALTNKVFDSLPGYPSLPPQLVCQLHNVTMHADEETDEVYAQMTLQTLSSQEQINDVYLPAEVGTRSKHPTNYFHKTLTASDTSTHGCCSIPRRAAEKVFPPLDFTQEPPAQELIAKDLHGNEWKFRHTFRGQPKRHLLTIGWTLFVNAKRLVAGDTVIFIWYGYNELLLGIRRANRHQRVIPGDNSMHVKLVAAHAAATNSPFSVSYFPRANPSEFVIPLAKYAKAVLHTRLFMGMRFRMLFETPESSVRRYMGKVVGIGDLDPVQWPNSHWRSVKVSWDEPTVGERQFRVSPWEIDPLTTFPMYPSPFPLAIYKHPWPPGLIPSHHGQRDDESMNLTSQVMMCLQNGGNLGLGFQSQNNVHGSSSTFLMQQRFDNIQSDMSHTTDTANKELPPQLMQQQTENTCFRSTFLQNDQIILQPPQNFLEIVQVNQVPVAMPSTTLFPSQVTIADATFSCNVSCVDFSTIPPVPALDRVCYQLPPSPAAAGPSLPPSPPETPLQESCSIVQSSNNNYSSPLTTSSFPVELGLLHPSFHPSLESLPSLEVCVNHHDSVGREFVAKNNERFFF
ncbi:auxin response factor 6-like [Canna indica]|uniref:Auxin response factor n=1 Tax=Canna indica TaxID=4628 RepID=A0AAQ3KT52_9LILI|nr:auxin response factor 6-like [Canna indica]